jgi:Family of unknown function (DUF6527)
MKIFRIIAEWCQQKYETCTSQRYKSIQVDNYPKKVAPRTVYIVCDGPITDTIIFKCPCGCKADIYLNLLKDTRPNWSYFLDVRDKVTISPSIWRKAGCKSHFFVRKGRICWV